MSATMARRVDNGTFSELVDELHERAGICGHCGKRDCPDRSAYSKLPATLSLQTVLGAMEKVLGVKP